MEQIFTSAGLYIDTTLFGFIGQVVARVIAYIGPIALGLITIWVLHTAIQFMLGKSSDPILEFAWKASMLYLIVGMATLGGLYHEWVIDTHNMLATSVVTMFASPKSALASVNSIWNALDVFNQAASDLAVQAAVDGVIKNFTPLLAVACALMFAIAVVVFLTCALCVVLFTKIISSFLLGVGPIFILTLMFQSTRQYFFNWLGALLGSVVLTWVVFFVLGFTLTLNAKMVEGISANLGFLNVLSQAIVFLVFCIAFGVFLWQSPSFASGLTGGSPMQLGAAALMQVVNTLRMGRTPPAPAGSPAAGGTVAANRAYNAGQAVGSAITSSAQWAYQRIAAAGGRRP
jgi:type IV secretion system protein VirB6